MKDLATLRNPQSPMTFLSYLHSQKRLVSFINRGSTVPSRKEYADYLAWAAQYVQNHGVDILYGHEVIALNRGRRDSTIDIRCRNLVTGNERVFGARKLLLTTISKLSVNSNQVISSFLRVEVPKFLNRCRPFLSIHLCYTVRPT